MANGPVDMYMHIMYAVFVYVLSIYVTTVCGKFWSDKTLENWANLNWLEGK